MKAGVLESIEHLVVMEVPAPKLERGSVVIKVKVCSICATDLRVYHHGHPRGKLPHILGHEIAGEIIAVAPDVKGYRAGDRVEITPRIACGECPPCRRGHHIYCQNSSNFRIPIVWRLCGVLVGSSARNRVRRSQPGCRCAYI